MDKQLQQLLATGVISEGSLLQCSDIRFSCIIQENGLLEVVGGPTWLRSLRDAARAAKELIEWGDYDDRKSVKAPNPLHFWSYHDDLTDRMEKLSRAWALAHSSSVCFEGHCSECVSATYEDRVGGLIDVYSEAGARPLRQIIAPRRHFTDHENIPARDRRAIFSAIQSEVSRLLCEGEREIRVIAGQGKAGHITYEVFGSDDPT